MREPIDIQHHHRHHILLSDIYHPLHRRPLSELNDDLRVGGSHSLMSDDEFDCYQNHHQDLHLPRC